MATAIAPSAAAAVTLRSGTTGLESVFSETERRRHSLVKNASDLLGVPPAKLCDLLRNVWTTSKGQPPLTDQEMFTGISLIARYQLDPITREIYVTRGKDGRLMTVVGIDGWIKILDRTDGYDGFDVEIKTDDKGRVEWIETRIYSTKRSHPTTYRAFWHEYMNLTGFMGQKIPSHMLRIFSLRHAARLFTPLGASVVTEEEASAMLRAEGPTEREAASSLDQLADEMVNRLSQPQQQAPADEAPTTPQQEASEPPPSPFDANKVRAAFAGREQLKEVADLEAELCLDDPEHEGDYKQLANERRSQIRPSRGGKQTQEAGS